MLRVLLALAVLLCRAGCGATVPLDGTAGAASSGDGDAFSGHAGIIDSEDGFFGGR